MKKRILGLLMAICLIIGLLPVTAFALSGKYLRIWRASSSSGSIDVRDADADKYFQVVSGVLTQVDKVPEDNYIKLSNPKGETPVILFKNITIDDIRGPYFGFKAIIASTTTHTRYEFDHVIVLEGTNTITTDSHQTGLALNVDTPNITTIMGTGTLNINTIVSDSPEVTNTVANMGAISVAGGLVIEKGVTININYHKNSKDNSLGNAITAYGQAGITVNGATININGKSDNGRMGSAFYTKGNLTIQNGSTININGKPIGKNLFDAASVTINDSTVTANIAAADETVGNVFANAPVIGEGLEAVASTEVITDPAQATPYDAANAASLKYFKVSPKQTTSPEANFGETQLVLEDDITVNFRADKATVVAAGGTQVKAQIGSATPTFIDLATVKVEDGYYVVPFTGVSAKQMGEDVTMTICDAEGNPVGQPKTDSVLAYALRTLKNKPAGHTDEQYAALKVLISDMLNYGAMAQDMFDYDEENMVTDGLTLQGTEEMKPVEAKAAATDAEGYLGTSFVLNNNIVMAMALDASVIGKTCTAKVTYKNYLGVDVVAESIVADATSTDNTTVFIFNGLVAADGRCEVTWAFYEGETLKLTVTDSMEAYVGRMLGKYPELAELMKYSDAAKEYFTMMNQ